MHIALATCSCLPEHEVDDLPLGRAIEALGSTVVEPSWDDESVDWERFDAVLIRTTWDYMDRCADFVAWAERISEGTQLHNSAAVLRWNTNKEYLKAFEQAGIATIPTVWIPAGETPDMSEMLRRTGWSRAFLKPTVGASASGTLRFDESSKGLSAASKHLDGLLAEQSFMLQPYLQRVETRGELSAIFIDGVLTHGVRKVPVAGDYRVQDDYGARDMLYNFRADEAALAREIVELANRFLGGAQLLYARVDFLLAEDNRLLLNEVELVEPSLFFRHAPQAARRLAERLLNRP